MQMTIQKYDNTYENLKHVENLKFFVYLKNVYTTFLLNYRKGLATENITFILIINVYFIYTLIILT